MQGKIPQGLALLGDEEGLRQRLVLQACALLMVMAELLRRAGMERHQAGFVELGLADVQLRRLEIELDIAHLEANRLPDAQPRAGQQPNQGR